tara:strand:+ start:956 stop:1849 length:894 start_codon:yes stop_codon:yes gene_type:complete
VKLPRFTSGSIGRLDYKSLNEAFSTIEKLADKALIPHGQGEEGDSYVGAKRESFIATITGLMTDAVQGSTQSTGQGTLWKTYVYNWNEVDISYGSAGTGTGVGLSDLQGARGIDYASGVTITPPASYYPAIDFAPYRRFADGDVVMLTRCAVKSGSTYSMMYAITPVSAVTPFLARLTSVVGTVGAGRYAWTGLTRLISGSSANKTEATNLYEKNRVSTPGLTSALSVNGTSWDGSGDWGHGQSLSQAGSTLTKLQLPTGAAGVGTVVIMHQSHVLESSGGTAFYFYSVAPVSSVCA